MVTLVNCPVCNSEVFSKVLSCKDYMVSGEVFTIVACSNCDFKLTNPRPSDDVLGNYYKSENYISHTNTKKGLVSKLYHLVRSYTLRRKIALISSYVSRGTILDYGCGTGMFLNACTKSGWKVFGLEPDDDARGIASEAKLEVFKTKAAFLSAHPSILFEVISLWHVLEHVTDLDATLNFLKLQLKPGGVLVIAVPNHLSFDAKKYHEHWAAYDVPRHLYHFQKSTIAKLLGNYGFELVDTHPMKFDSFYVSMLSEKYLSGSVRYLRAFLAGLRSNAKASITQEYSSRIYIFRQR